MLGRVTGPEPTAPLVQGKLVGRPRKVAQSPKAAATAGTSRQETSHRRHCRRRVRTPAPHRSRSRTGASARSPIAHLAAMRSFPTANPPACPGGRCLAAVPPRAASRPAAPRAPAVTARGAAGPPGTAGEGPAIAAARDPPFPCPSQEKR
ncbi:uncharacterized protein LJ264_013040 [Porphyrio hochstetteri]